LPIKICKNRDLIRLSINSTEISKDLCKWLKLDFNLKDSRKKSYILQFPDLETEELKWHFLRGYLDGDGCILFQKCHKNRIPACNISSYSTKMLQSKDFCNINCCLGDTKITYCGSNAIKFLNNIYNNSTIYLKRKYIRYISFKHWFPHCIGHYKLFKYIRTIPQAILHQ